MDGRVNPTSVSPAPLPESSAHARAFPTHMGGHSIIEAVTVMAVIGILVTTGLWSAQSSLAARALDGAVHTLASDIATCKGMALKQGRRFRILLSNGGETSYAILREVFPQEPGYNADNPFQTFRSIDPVPETTSSSIRLALQTNYPRRTITFQPRGTANPGRVQFSTGDGTIRKQIVVAITGRVRLCAAGTDPGCSPLE